ncbi:MAG: ATP-binding cassette domain-containing protein [Bacteroidales bacterium]|nr:ATP-binding cassette domain-containing protein [Bacteroidales bacterium]
MAKITLRDAVPGHPDYQFRQPINIEIPDGNNIAVIGRNGSGKSMFVDIMLSNILCSKPSYVCLSENGVELTRDKVKYMSFRDIYRMSDGGAVYYQQRWNATENEESPLVTEILGKERCKNNIQLIRDLHIEDILSKRLIFLSSGELRKMQIFRILLARPRVLVIDNPYIGLDAESRDVVNDLLGNISRNEKIQIILVLSNPADIPAYIDKVIPIHAMDVLPVMEKEEFLADKALHDKLFSIDFPGNLPSAAQRDAEKPYENAVIMNKVHIRYFTKQILRDLDWTVRRGEKWALLGRNGCGKSTLLSLVCGDNPQAYANDITLFDCPRGTGESIWEIKSHIGYLSPDMHTYYQHDMPCIDVVATGFFDTVGLHRMPNDEQRRLALEWMKVFGADHLANKSFVKISYGEQRIVLLARVFVKSPSLLILDEPLHGLDVGKKKLAKDVIEKYCSTPDVTLIYVTHYRHEIPSIVNLEKTLVKIE